MMIAIRVMALLFGLGATAAHAGNVRRQPDWVSTPPATGTGGTAYFVGMNEDASSLELGQGLGHGF